MPFPTQLTGGNEARSTSANHSLFVCVSKRQKVNGTRSFVDRIATHHRAPFQGEPR